MQCKNLKTQKEYKAELEMDVAQWVGKPLVTAKARDHVLQLATLPFQKGWNSHPPSLEPKWLREKVSV